ncbi:peptidase, partial [Collinsella aerofaciens]|nr:peptidase [Collinsella aerofaciens]
MPYYYGYGFGIDPLYLLVVLVCTVIGLAAQNYINSTYKTWSKVRSDGDTGATVGSRAQTWCKSVLRSVAASP